MPEEAKHGLMVKYQFEIDDESWEDWKNTVPRSKSLEQRIIELIEADTEGRVRPPDEEDIADTGSSDDGPETVIEADQTDVEAKEETYADLADSVEQDEEERDAEAILRDLGLSGSGSKKEARVNAVMTFYEYLRDRRGERISKSDLKTIVEDCDLDVGYASFNSLWNNWVKANESQGRDFNTLAQLPGVEMDGDDYVYRGESA
jgi:hypothetical protein